MLLKLIKKVRNEMKKEAELHNAMRRIARIPLDMELLQTMVNAAANSQTPVDIEVKTIDGATIRIQPTSRSQTDYVSFREKYQNRNV